MADAPGQAIFDELGLIGAAAAAPVRGGPTIGWGLDQPVAPASVMKIQVALAVESAIATGDLDGRARRVLRADRRTAGPVGVSLMRDDVVISVRDLVVAMLTISDNVATDELIGVIGLDRVNDLTLRLGRTNTRITADLRDLLDGMATEVGFADYAALAADGIAGLRRQLARTGALDPERGSRTTARDTVSLLQAIWTDCAGPPVACAAVRSVMADQLTRHRIASGFGSDVAVAAKSGGLMGVIRNEAGVVTLPDGAAYAVAVFTRTGPQAAPPADIDAGIGTIARTLVAYLRSANSP